MSILNLFNFSKNKPFKGAKKKDNSNEKNEKIIGLLNVREENTNNMFKNIEKYTQIRDQLVRRSILEEKNISEVEGIDIINDFIENIAEQLPQGILVPIKTSFVYRGKSQVLFVGNNIMTVGKSLRENSTKPRHTMKSKEYVGFLLDYNEELNVFDQNNNTRLSLSKDNRLTIINLINNHIIDTKTVNCRVSNIEFIFEDWQESLESVKCAKTCGIVGELIEFLPSLDYEVTTEVTKFLEKQIEIENEKLEKGNAQNTAEQDTNKILENENDEINK